MKSPLVLTHWQSAFPALCPLMPRILQVHFIGLHSEKKQSAGKTLSVIYHLDILSWLTKCTDFFLHQILFFFTVKEDLLVIGGKMLPFIQNLNFKQRIYTPGYLQKLDSFKILESSLFVYRWLTRGWCRIERERQVLPA